MAQITHPNIQTMRAARCRAFAGQVSAILAADCKASAG
jgi:hypothetical protein